MRMDIHRARGPAQILMEPRTRNRACCRGPRFMAVAAGQCFLIAWVALLQGVSSSDFRALQVILRTPPRTWSQRNASPNSEISRNMMKHLLPRINLNNVVPCTNFCRRYRSIVVKKDKRLHSCDSQKERTRSVTENGL